MTTEKSVNGPRCLGEARREAADTAFQNYAFGGLTVAETCGWECSVPGLQYRRTVHFENPAGGDSIKGSFTVIFDGYDSHCVRAIHATGGKLTGSSAGYTSAPSFP